MKKILSKIIMVIMVMGLVFVPNSKLAFAEGPDEPFALSESSIQDGATNVKIDTQIDLKFNKNTSKTQEIIDYNKTQITLKDKDGNLVPIDISMSIYDGSDPDRTKIGRVSIKPTERLEYNGKYKLIISENFRCNNLDFKLAGAIEINFSTLPTNGPDAPFMLSEQSIFNGQKDIELDESNNLTIKLKISKNISGANVIENNRKCFTIIDKDGNLQDIDVQIVPEEESFELRNYVTIIAKGLKEGSSYKLIISKDLAAKNGETLEDYNGVALQENMIITFSTKGVEVSVDKEKLIEALENANKIIKEDEETEGGKYTEESILKLKEVIALANLVVENDEATQDEVDSITLNIGQVIEVLEIKEDKDQGTDDKEEEDKDQDQGIDDEEEEDKDQDQGIDDEEEEDKDQGTDDEEEEDKDKDKGNSDSPKTYDAASLTLLGGALICSSGILLRINKRR